jgi:integrase
MVRLAEEYLAYRRQLGFQFHSAGRLLLRFAEYADRTGHRGPLTAELAVRWAGLMPRGSLCYAALRLDVVRGFARHRAIFDPQTEIPPSGVFGAARRRPAPYIYSEAEIEALLAAARRLPPGTGLRPHTYATFFGLLACTGLRLSEALGLTGADVDGRRGLLTVRRTKYRKSRLVPVHPSTAQALLGYVRRRDRFHPARTTDAFFLSSRGTPLCGSTVQGVFGKLRDQLSWSDRGGRRPRIHSLRHTFACRRLLRWYEEGADVDHAIAALATYLGHSAVAHTYWYLSATPELLELTAARFERFAATGKRDGS